MWLIVPSARRATSPDEGKTLTPTGETQVLFERGSATELVFAPHTTTVYDFALAQPTTPVEQRPDLGDRQHEHLRAQLENLLEPLDA